MTAVLALDLALVFAASLWLVLSAGILCERVRYERRSRRLVALTDQLRRANDGDLEQKAAGVSVADFEQLVVDGVPPRVEAAVARALVAGGQGEARLQMARGETTTDVWKRIRAARLLTSARADGVHPALDQMLRSGDRVLAAAALRFMVQLDDHRSAELMIQALLDGAHSRSRIAAAFDALTVERSEMLAPLFASEESSCRYWAARLAGFLGARAWAGRIRELTADLDPFVRRAAVETLGALGGAGDLPMVRELFSDPAPIVRAYAARAAGALSGTVNEATLRHLLADSAWIVRAAAAEVLAASRVVARGDAAPAA